MRFEHYGREENGEWHYRVVSAGGRVILSNGVIVELDSVYAGVFELEGE